jgi:hypothetical protein
MDRSKPDVRSKDASGLKFFRGTSNFIAKHINFRKKGVELWAFDGVGWYCDCCLYILNLICLLI